MREFLLRIYSYMKQLPEDHTLRAASAVALGMLTPGDRLAVDSALVSGGVSPEQLAASIMDNSPNPAIAVGSALALRLQNEGGVVVAPVPSDQAQSPDFPALLQLSLTQHLPIVFLMECDEDFPDDLEAQAALGEIERIQADSLDAMRLMPALRLAIDKAREGDGPTLIECITEPAPDEPLPSDPAQRLAEVLITEGYARPEELL